MLKIAVVGAGLIGKRHLAAVRAAGGQVAAVVDPDPATAPLAQQHQAPLFTSLEAMLVDGVLPDGLVIATPNALHARDSLAAIAAGLPVLVEKPLADDLADARAMVAAAQQAGVPLLTGHHRRHMGVITRAREVIASGALGQIVAVHASFWLAKPDGYFDVAWRREPGAGPLLINLIHDIDLLRFLVGEVASVQAQASRAVRGFAVEDGCAALLRFTGGALGTLQVSDSTVSPWSWELTAGDNPAYPPTGENALLIAGTLGSLALPSGQLWSDGGKRDWWQPISRTTLLRGAEDPLVAQMRNFLGVIAGREAPVCSGEEGLRSLATLLAIQQAAHSGQTVTLSPS